jgi:hypothetical protein
MNIVSLSAVNSMPGCEPYLIGFVSITTAFRALTKLSRLASSSDCTPKLNFGS